MILQGWKYGKPACDPETSNEDFWVTTLTDAVIIFPPKNYGINFVLIHSPH